MALLLPEAAAQRGEGGRGGWGGGQGAAFPGQAQSGQLASCCGSTPQASAKPQGQAQQRPTCDRSGGGHRVRIARADGLGDGLGGRLGVTLCHSVRNGCGLRRGIRAQVAAVGVCEGRGPGRMGSCSRGHGRLRPGQRRASCAAQQSPDCTVVGGQGRKAGRHGRSVLVLCMAGLAGEPAPPPPLHHITPWRRGCPAPLTWPGCAAQCGAGHQGQQQERQLHVARARCCGGVRSVAAVCSG